MSILEHRIVGMVINQRMDFMILIPFGSVPITGFAMTLNCKFFIFPLCDLESRFVEMNHVSYTHCSFYHRITHNGTLLV